MERIKAFIKECQEKGVPVFFIRNDGKPSVTLTLVVLSATFVMFGLINGAAKLVHGIDMQSALYWHGMTLAAYLGRKVTGDGKKIDMAAEEKKEP